MEFNKGERVYHGIYGAGTVTKGTKRPIRVWVKWNKTGLVTAVNPVQVKHVMCGCESIAHFNDKYGPQISHDYLGIPAGEFTQPFIGEVCNECNDFGCMKDVHLTKN